MTRDAPAELKRGLLVTLSTVSTRSAVSAVFFHFIELIANIIEKGKERGSEIIKDLPFCLSQGLRRALPVQS